MSKKDMLILTVTGSLLVLFLLNYFVTLPSINSYFTNVERLVEVETELSELQEDIAQGAELESAIEEQKAFVGTLDIEEYLGENYTVHNFFVDSAENFNLVVNSLTLSEATEVNTFIVDGGTQIIAAHPLVEGQMSDEEIDAVANYYRIMTQTCAMTVTGTADRILDYVDALAKNDIYLVIPSLSMSDFVGNEEEIELSLQFIKYTYMQAPQELTTEISL